jgi:TM2 domain-containing membrane protein YozV
MTKFAGGEMDKSKVCPKCGYISIDESEFESCPQCGIVIKKHFEKYIDKQKMRQEEVSSESREKEQGLHQEKIPTENVKFCSNCGAKIDKKAEICPKCGVRQALIKKPGEKERLTAGLFAILLGGLGVHKFYLGKTGLGILYLIFCWTFIPSIVGLIEGIMYLTMSDEEFKIKHVQ